MGAGQAPQEMAGSAGSLIDTTKGIYHIESLEPPPISKESDI